MTIILSVFFFSTIFAYTEDSSFQDFKIAVTPVLAYCGELDINSLSPNPKEVRISPQCYHGYRMVMWCTGSVSSNVYVFYI